MKCKKLLVLLLACVAAFAFAFTTSAQTSGDYTGWDYDDMGNYVYFINGEMVTNDWIVDGDGNKYYVGADGVKYQSDIYEIDGAWYGFDWEGIMQDDTHFFVQEYNEELGYYEDTFYCARPGGELYINSWAWPTYSYGGSEENTKWYFAGEDGALLMGMQNISGKYYYFDENNGEMYYDNIFGKYDAESDRMLTYYAQGGAADGALAQNQWVYNQEGYWNYYGNDCARVEDAVAAIGDKLYAFDYSGIMYYDTIVSIYDETAEQWEYYYAQGGAADGALLTNTWYQHYSGGTWYYYGADGKRYNDGVAQINGNWYCFNEWGEMLEDTAECITVNGVEKYFVADKYGYPYEVQNNCWIYVDGAWYYVQDGEFCYNGVYLIGGQYYGFDWDNKMYDGEMFEIAQYDDDWNWLGYKYYYAKPGGALARNEVVSISRYGEEEAPFLFGDDCAIPDHVGLYVLNDNVYYLRGYSSSVYARGILETEEGVYLFDKNGVGTKLSTGWHLNNTSAYKGDWYWVYVQDDALLTDGIYQIGDKRYAFNYDGYLLTDRIYYDDTIDKYWLLTYMDEAGNGGSVCEEKNVWKTVNGYYVYLVEDSTLHEGWLFDKYYLDPYMAYCNYIADEEGYVYAVNAGGETQKVTTTGTFSIYGATYYLDNGKIVTSKWEYIDGAWYYFNDYGMMYVDGAYEVDGVYYYFDTNGKMYDNGWIRSSYGTWYWAYDSGALYTGIDGAGQVFREDGSLAVDDVVLIDDTLYVTDIDGKTVGTLDQTGWNLVGNDWYYVATYEQEDGGIYKEVLTGSYYDADGRFFAFDSKGRMLANQFYNDDYYLGEGGEALKGWQWIDGYWYYGNPEDYGQLYTDGIYTINDKDYAFDTKGALKQNQTFFSWDYDKIITTDSEGIVINMADVNGWVYEEDSYWGDGDAYYYVNGEIYTGWVGNYYIDYGHMAINQIIYDDATDKHYCIDKMGSKVTYGWYEIWENDWIFAQADGTLIYNDWLFNNGRWYYFDGVYMVYDNVIEIDGALHEFDENGVWIGEYQENDRLDFTGKNDGWVYIDGNWYFSMAGEPVWGEELYINGNWYYFDYNGVMISNQFHCNYQYDSFGLAYYTAGGERAEYTGWHWINDNWVYFSDDHLAYIGWINDGGRYYYQEEIYNDDYYYAHIDGVAMVTGYQVIDDVLYYFDNGGMLIDTITSYGWHQAGSDWYFVDESGKAVRGEGMYKVGGTYYAFDYDGKMIANGVYGDRYYDAGGALVTNMGWYMVDGEWIYVTARGTVACDGVFRIDGRDYYFYDSVWIG